MGFLVITVRVKEAGLWKVRCLLCEEKNTTCVMLFSVLPNTPCLQYPVDCILHPALCIFFGCIGCEIEDKSRGMRRDFLVFVVLQRPCFFPSSEKTERRAAAVLDKRGQRSRRMQVEKLPVCRVSNSTWRERGSARTRTSKTRSINVGSNLDAGDSHAAVEEEKQSHHLKQHKRTIYVRELARDQMRALQMAEMREERAWRGPSTRKICYS